jgi:hypothetical protein
MSSLLAAVLTIGLELSSKVIRVSIVPRCKRKGNLAQPVVAETSLQSDAVTSK